MIRHHYLVAMISAFALSLSRPLYASGGAGTSGVGWNGYTGRKRRKLKGWQKNRRKR